VHGGSASIERRFGGFILNLKCVRTGLREQIRLAGVISLATPESRYTEPFDISAFRIDDFAAEFGSRAC
jgi:hypothetical protein